MATSPDPRLAESGAARGPRSALVRRLLRVPLFYKILIANAGIVVLGAVAGSLLTAEFVREGGPGTLTEVVLVFAVAGVGVSVFVNAIILRLALEPLQSLEETAARVQRGDVDARAPRSPLADRDIQHLTEVFNGMLDRQADYRRRLRDVTARALGAAEEERKRIARELHDETAQALAALLIRLRLARGVTDPAAREELLAEVRSEIAETLEGVRRYARGLRPPALDELGLVPAIESHARALSENVGLSIRVDAAGMEGVLSAPAELAIYRIVQESLSNVARHAGAETARVTLREYERCIVATVRDDGRGFVVKEKLGAAGGGLGLFGMRERAAYLGGTVRIGSLPGVGTVVRAWIPKGPRSPLDHI